ncbi:hypothetical protein [Nocardia thraciensis]
MSSAANLDDEVAELLRLAEWWPAAELFVATGVYRVREGAQRAISSAA